MKIVKIEIDESSKHLNVGGIVLYSVVLTTRHWLFFKKRIHAFPTGYVRLYKNEIQYFYYCDTLGKEFEEKICKQIMNFVKTRELYERNI